MLKSHRKRWFLSVLVYLSLGVGVSLFAYQFWIHGSPHTDFYPRWAGARLLLLEGRDLYSEATTRQMQIMLYSAPLPPEQDQQGFAYPAQIVVILFPFWLIPDVEVATAIWVGVSTMLLVGVMLVARPTQTRLPLWVIALLLTNQYVVLMLFQGQITAIPLVAIVGGSWAYHHQRDYLSGCLLALGCIKPELIAVPALALLGVALWQRRWRVVGALAVASGILVLASLLVAGWWVGEWLAALQRYAVYAKVIWAARDIWALNGWLALALVMGLIVSLMFMRWESISLIAAAVPLGLFLLPQTLLWGLTLLTFPLALAWRGMARWGVAGVWVLSWVFLFVLPTFVGWQIQSAIMSVLTLGVLAWSTRLPETPQLLSLASEAG